jgi:hypothetical protein
MIAAYEASWPEENARFTSDDTKLLRRISDEQPIRLEPGFSATYRPRTTVKRFLAHALNRGTMFVDSYAGTSRARDAVLLLLVVLPPLFLVAAAASAITGRWRLLGTLGALVVVARADAGRAVLLHLHRAVRRRVLARARPRSSRASSGLPRATIRNRHGWHLSSRPLTRVLAGPHSAAMFARTREAWQPWAWRR